MTKSAPQALRATLELLGSGMQGQFHTNDTLGLWTFNEKLNTDMPMQIWTETNKARIMEAIATFWRAQPYVKKSRLDVVLPSLTSVIKNSRTLTVLWINDGTSVIHGTPFDSQINQLHAEYAHEMREANECFVTVLACRNGEVVDFAVNSSIGPFRIPSAQPPSAPKPPVIVKAPTNALTPVKPREMKEVVIGPPPKTNIEPKTNALTNVLPSDANVAAAPITTSPASALSEAENQFPLATNIPPITEAPLQVETKPTPVSLTPSVRPVAVQPSQTAAQPSNTAGVSTPAAVPQKLAQTPPAASAPDSAPTAPIVASAPAVNTELKQAEGETAPAQHRMVIWILMGVAVVISYVLLRFLRKERSRPSLISESMKRAEGGARQFK